MCNCLEPKDWITLVGVAISSLLFIIAVLSYKKAEKQKRAEHFFKLRDKYNSEEPFLKIRQIIDSADKGEIKSSLQLNTDEARRVLGFYEEIAILVNSGLLNKNLAYYMFGYYAINCSEMKIFESYMQGEEKYWMVFTQFVEKMKIIGQKIDKTTNFNYDKINFKSPFF
jgi:hypothetical protein